jgi:hypothetical protein
MASILPQRGSIRSSLSTSTRAGRSVPVRSTNSITKLDDQFVDELMPCMQKAVDQGQEARVMSILAAGTGGALDVDDLGLKKSFSLFRAARQAPTYNDIMAEVCSWYHMQAGKG